MKQPRPYPVYAVTPKAERSLTAGHPWVYGEEIIREPEVTPENGALVDVVSRRGAIWAPACSAATARSASGSSAAAPTTALTRPSGAAVWSTPGPTAGR